MCVVLLLVSYSYHHVLLLVLLIGIPAVGMLLCCARGARERPRGVDGPLVSSQFATTRNTLLSKPSPFPNMQVRSLRTSLRQHCAYLTRRLPNVFCRPHSVHSGTHTASNATVANLCPPDAIGRVSPGLQPPSRSLSKVRVPLYLRATRSRCTRPAL